MPIPAIHRARVGSLVLVASVLLAAAACAAAQSLEYRLFLNQGYRAFHSAQYVKACDYFTRAIAIDPDAAEARLGLADACATTGDYLTAAGELRRGLALDPKWPERDYPRYGMYRDTGELERVLKNLRKQADAYQKDVNVRILLGYSLFHLCQLAESRDVFEQVKKLEPKDVVLVAYDKALVQRGVLPPKPKDEEKGKPEVPARRPLPTGPGGAPSLPGQPGGPMPIAGGPPGMPGVGGPGAGIPAVGGPAVGMPVGGPAVGVPAGGPAVGMPVGGPAVGVPAGGPAVGMPMGGPAVGVPAGGPAVGVPAGGPAVGVPAAGGPAVGMPTAGGPAVGVPAAGGPAVGVPASGGAVPAAGGSAPAEVPGAHK